MKIIKDIEINFKGKKEYSFSEIRYSRLNNTGAKTLIGMMRWIGKGKYIKISKNCIVAKFGNNIMIYKEE